MVSAMADITPYLEERGPGGVGHYSQRSTGCFVRLAAAREHFGRDNRPVGESQSQLHQTRFPIQGGKDEGEW